MPEKIFFGGPRRKKVPFFFFLLCNMPRGRKRKQKECASSAPTVEENSSGDATTNDISEATEAESTGVSVGDPLPYDTTVPSPSYFTDHWENVDSDGLAGAVDRVNIDYQKRDLVKVYFHSKSTYTEPIPCDVLVAKGYFQSLLRRRELIGTWHINKITIWNDMWTTYHFDPSCMCPICKKVHDSYGFCYRVKKGCYAGWKCWKEKIWETDFHTDMLHLMEGNHRIAGDTED